MVVIAAILYQFGYICNQFSMVILRLIKLSRGVSIIAITQEAIDLSDISRQPLALFV